MTAFETTRRDLAMVPDWAMVPVSWQSVTAGDAVLSGVDGLVWHVVRISKHYATAIVSLAHAGREHVAEVDLDAAVHVLENSTGFRRSQYSGTEPVRLRTPKTR